MEYETHLPAQQDTPQKEMRLPRQNENHLRPQGHQPTPQSRQKASGRLSLPKERRLLKKSHFSKVTKEGKRLVGKYLCIDYLRAPKGRLGISASTRYGSAPERNRFKRLVREAYRLSGEAFAGADLHVIPRQNAKQAGLAEIQHEILSLIKSSPTKSG